MSSSYKLYEYNPSVGAAIVFAGVFAATSVLHLFQMVRRRTWYFTPFIIGGFFEAFGYVARWYKLLLLLAPSLFSASIYMLLGRIIRLVHGDSRSLIRPNWLTKIFVTGDVLSFFIQSGGGGMMASANSASSVSLGNRLIVIGLIVQLAFFGFFILVSMVFHRRMTASPTPTSLSISNPPWYTYMRVLYAASILIMVRSIYRVVEYVQGTSGVLQQHEIYLYIFDAVLMLLVCLLFNIMHPSRILSKRQPYGKMESDQIEMLDPRM
ncbi:RTA1 like protein [Aspergillus violaceofuscus CBS 115571]|uniref:RTA1 like protein n=1 Tax=Aspergillus violaceofuscus (strain CBS 115571) TaxID=1450538 RepID=A0A2V5HIH2_ASPV1|nr:RTA1 like protein [Aspergillus violaceofuscus CBS 115571]